MHQTAPQVPEILLATDFSATSRAAGRIAFDYARALGARLHVLHVARPGQEASAGPPLVEEAGHFDGVLVVAAVETGSPAEEIVRYARREGVDLIVVGTHGRTGFTRVLLGSVAERVTRTAPCPVLTVPPGAQAGSEPVLEVEPHGHEQNCLVCAEAAEDLVCESCRARIRGEAIEHKLEEQRAGRG